MDLDESGGLADQQFELTTRCWAQVSRFHVKRSSVGEPTSARRVGEKRFRGGRELDLLGVLEVVDGGKCPAPAPTQRPVNLSIPAPFSAA